MLFQAKSKYKWLLVVLFLSIAAFGAHTVYADKSDLSGGNAYDAPVDLSEPSSGDEWPQYDMFEDHSSTSEPSYEAQEMESNEMGGLKSTGDIERSWEEEDRLRDGGSDYSSDLDVQEVGKPKSANEIERRWEEKDKIRSADEEYAPEKYEQDLVIRSQGGEDHFFSIELALTGSEMERGLMFRKSMPKMHGMLFVFHSSAQRSFWMRNTLIPLDIIFIEQDGRIGHIHHQARPLDESMITSSGKAWAVLEINGGMAHTLGIKEGDMVLHTAFKNRHTE